MDGYKPGGEAAFVFLNSGDDRQNKKALFELSEIKYLRNLRFYIL